MEYYSISYIHLIIQLCYDCCILIELLPLGSNKHSGDAHFEFPKINLRNWCILLVFL